MQQAGRGSEHKGVRDGQPQLEGRWSWEGRGGPKAVGSVEIYELKLEPDAIDGIKRKGESAYEAKDMRHPRLPHAPV